MEKNIKSRGIVMKENIGDLGKTEWALLNICWKKGPKTTAKEIHTESLKNRYRSYVTVKTILDRLVDKGYLEREMLGPVWLYTPKRSPKMVLSSAMDDFMSTVMDHDKMPLLKHLLSDDISPEEIQAIQQLIKTRKK